MKIIDLKLLFIIFHITIYFHSSLKLYKDEPDSKPCCKESLFTFQELYPGYNLVDLFLNNAVGESKKYISVTNESINISSNEQSNVYESKNIE